MSQRITRRALLGGGIKAGIGLAVWTEFNLGQLSGFAITPPSASGWMSSSLRTCATWARRA